MWFLIDACILTHASNVISLITTAYPRSFGFQQKQNKSMDVLITEDTQPLGIFMNQRR